MITKPSKNWGMEKNIQIPNRIYASDDDLTSDGKLILCSRKQKQPDDVEYINKEWMTKQLEDILNSHPDTLVIVKKTLNL